MRGAKGLGGEHNTPTKGEPRGHGPGARLLQPRGVLPDLGDLVHRQEVPQLAEAHVTLELRRPQRGALLVARHDCDCGVRHRNRRFHGQLQRPLLRRGKGLLPLKRGELGLQPRDTRPWPPELLRRGAAPGTRAFRTPPAVSPSAPPAGVWTRRMPSVASPPALLADAWMPRAQPFGRFQPAPCFRFELRRLGHSSR